MNLTKLYVFSTARSLMFLFVCTSCPTPGTVRTVIQSNIPYAYESPPNSKKAFSTIRMLPSSIDEA